MERVPVRVLAEGREGLARAALRFRRAVGNGVVDGVVQLRHSRALEQQMQLQRPAVVVLLRIELALQLHRQPH